MTTVAHVTMDYINSVTPHSAVKMDILHSWSSRTLVHVGVIEVLGTIVLCYVLAVVNGHVPAWLPMISDCAVYSPEKYPFRLGIVVGACLVALQVVTTYYGDRAYSRSRLCFTLGLVASAGLAVVGVVNEKENDNIHDVAAVTFFVGYDVYAVLMTMFSWKEPKVSIFSFVLKVCLSVIANLSFIGYMLLKYGHIHWYGNDIPLAIFEWANTIAVMLFLWTFVLDKIDDISLSEIKNVSHKEKSIPGDSLHYEHKPEQKMFI